MGTVIIRNLSTIKDRIAIYMANDILNGDNTDQLIKDADLFQINITVRNDEKADARVVTITDRD